MNDLLERLKSDLQNEEARYVYADTVTNTFIAAQIKALREDRGLTQADLADLMGTKQSGISRLQKTDYSAWKVETLRKFARAFGVRLRIRFEEFGTVLDEIDGFDAKSLTPRKFEDDPAFKESVAGLEPERAAVRSVSLAGAKVGDQLPDWENRLNLAVKIMEWGKQFAGGTIPRQLAGLARRPTHPLQPDLGLAPNEERRLPKEVASAVPEQVAVPVLPLGGSRIVVPIDIKRKRTTWTNQKTVNTQNLSQRRQANY